MRDSGMRRRGASLALFFSVGLGSPAPLSAAPDPFLEPGNMGVRFLLHGGGEVTPDIAADFRRLCRLPGRVNLALLGDGGPSPEWWTEKGFSIVPPTEANALWLHSGKGFEFPTFDPAVIDLLRTHVVKNGPIGISGPACAAFAGEDFLPEPAVPLLPRAVVAPDFDRSRRQALLESIDARPGWVGYGLPNGTAMIVDGRDFHITGERPLTICLPTSDHRQGNFRAARGADHLAQIRAARARVLEPAFPPPEFPGLALPAGQLMIVGGGATPSALLRRFVGAAGPGGRILVVPTAEADNPKHPKQAINLFRKYGAEDVRVFHARTAAEADREDFAAAIDAAAALWFNGGRQWRLVDRYAGTRSHAAMLRLLARGGVIGGSSAGATICGDYLVRGDPLGPGPMMCEGYERGLAFLPGTAIDQHVSQRNRAADMEALKARYPQLLGIGLDETTALVIQGETLEVIGRGRVFIHSGGKAADAPAFPCVVLSDGMRYSLAERAPIPSDAEPDFP